MNTKKMDFLILAALIHDIGKLLERGQIFPEVREDVYYLSVCPEHNGSYEHLHCAYTRKFCEVLEGASASSGKPPISTVLTNKRLFNMRFCPSIQA